MSDRGMRDCAMSALVHGQQDGRLGERETGALQRHMRACRACQQLAADLQQLAALGRRAGEVAPLRELEHRRRRRQLLTAASSMAQGSMPQAGAMGQAGSMLQAISSTLASWLQAGSMRLRSPGAGRRLLLAVCMLPALLLLWSRLQPQQARGDVGALAAALGPRHAIEATVEASAGSRVWRALEGGIDRVRLDDGTILTTVDKLTPGQRFIVTTRDAEVEVRGTRFLVRAERGALREVNVLEGKVEVRHGATITMLLPGQHWQPPSTAHHHGEQDPDADDAPPFPDHGAPGRHAALNTNAAAGRSLAPDASAQNASRKLALNAGAKTAERRSATNASKQNAGRSLAANTGAHNAGRSLAANTGAQNATPNHAANAGAQTAGASNSSHRDAASPQGSAKQPTARSETGAPSTPAAAGSSSGTGSAKSASRAFIRAMELLERGHYNRASQAMRAFLRHHPKSTFAEDAAFMNAIALQRAGRHAAARQAARDYLKRYPRGDRRAQALRIANNKPPR